MSPEQHAQATEYIPTARGIAWQYFQRAPHALDLEELQGVALHAVVQAVERFPRYQEARGADPDAPETRRYLVGYVTMRIHGALTDHMRSADWVTRAERQVIKQLQAAEAALGPGTSTAEQAAHAGIALRDAERALASLDKRPGYLDNFEAEGNGAAEIIADETPDADSAVFVHSVLDQVADTVEHLDETSMWIVLLRYVHGLSLPKVAEGLGITPDECRKRWETAVCELHDIMLMAVQPGCQCGSSGACSCAA